MNAIIKIIDMVGWHVFSILSITSVLVYAGLVILGYMTEGPRYPVKFEFTAPFRSAERAIVGLGVRVLAVVVRAVNALLDPLFDVSAHLGEWVTQQSNDDVQAWYRSRFI